MTVAERSLRNGLLNSHIGLDGWPVGRRAGLLLNPGLVDADEGPVFVEGRLLRVVLG